MKHITVQKSTEFFPSIYIPRESLCDIMIIFWVGFYGISTFVGYWMLIPLYTYILNI